MTGSEIKKRRKAINLLQINLSKKIGYKYQAQLSHFEERGDNPIASIYTEKIDKALCWFERKYKGLPPVEKLEADVSHEVVRIFASAKTRKRENGMYEIFIFGTSYGKLFRTGDNRATYDWHIENKEGVYRTRETAVLAVCLSQVGVI